MKKNRIRIEPKRTQKIPFAEKLIEGRVDLHADGFGFVISKNPEEPNVYVAKEELKDVMSRDEVMVRVHPHAPGSQRWSGSIVKIIKRNSTELLAGLRVYKGGALLIPMDERNRHITYKVKELKSPFDKLKNGACVVARITEFPDKGTGYAEVIEEVKDPKSASQDTLKILVSHNWPRQHSDAAQKEANAAAKDWLRKAEKEKSRINVRHLPLVTIDGRDARDFDDAVCAEKIPGSQNIKLTVAIADVSYFVKEGAALDIEAASRSTSVYFPDHVVPMLPEVLSNGVCSLNPNEPRACLACEMVITPKGKIQEYAMFEGIMESKKRITYEEMQGFLEKQPWAQELLFKVSDSLDLLSEVFNRLHVARIARGAIDLDLPEPLIQLNSEGEVTDIQSRIRLDAHRLIEECMLAANQCAAHYLFEKSENGVYRIHEVPDAKKIGELVNFLELNGVHVVEKNPHRKKAVPKKGGKDSKGDKGSKGEKIVSAPEGLFTNPEDFSELLTSLHESLDSSNPLIRAISVLVLRSMKQARYSTVRVGHFALALEDYTHFTSPIRRYPDLLVHRLIRSLLRKETWTDQSQLESKCLHSSEQERLAMEMERKLTDIKKCRYLEKHLGDEFPATIMGLTEKGCFAQIEGHYVDGLIHADTLARFGRFLFQAKTMCYLGPGQTKLSLGSRVKIRVAAVDIETRRIDFELLKIEGNPY